MSNGPPVYNVNSGKRESGVSALAQVAVVALVVAGAVFGWYKFSFEKKRVADLAVAAKQKTEADDHIALLAAEKLFGEIGTEEKLTEDDAILVSLAEIQAQLYQAYGLASAKAKAERYVGMARDRDVKKAERYAAEAYLLLGDNRAAEAEAMLLDIVQNKGARHAKLLHGLAVAKLAQGKAKDAVVSALEGQKLSTQLVRLPIAEGDAYLAQGNFAAAANAYNKAKKLNPDHLRARTAITIVAAVSRLGKPELLLGEMDRLMAEATAEAPPRVRGFIDYGKGEIYLVDNKSKEALASAEASLATDPGQAATLALKGRALAKLGKVDDAKKAFDEALTAAPSSLPIAKAAALTLKRAGKEKDGVVYLQKVVTANPENGMAHAELALVQAAIGQGKDALKTADEAIAKLGNASDLAVFAKARALHADKQLVPALDTYKEALSYHANPEWPELYFALADLRFDEKNWDEAIGAYESAIKFWDKQGGSIDDVADAWEQIGKSYQGMGGKKAKQAKEYFEKADNLRKGKTS
ncbi:MAG: tetratricopeptide repeat protein [Deltaproteobacteria bacterium]|nr:tetratricopeptide repeat protein [Deltaproteobacteria bacterium]